MTQCQHQPNLVRVLLKASVVCCLYPCESIYGGIESSSVHDHLPWLQIDRYVSLVTQFVRGKVRKTDQRMMEQD